MGYTVHGILQARILEWVAIPFSKGSSQSRDWTHSLPAEPTGQSEKTGVSSLSLLQQIFQTQELNKGHLNCRQILYQAELGFCHQKVQAIIRNLAPWTPALTFGEETGARHWFIHQWSYKSCLCSEAFINTR